MEPLITCTTSRSPYAPPSMTIRLTMRLNTAVHCNTPPHAATRCAAPRCTKLHHVATPCTNLYQEMAVTMRLSIRLNTLTTSRVSFNTGATGCCVVYACVCMCVMCVYVCLLVCVYVSCLAESDRRRRLLQNSETTSITAEIQVFQTKSDEVSNANIQTAFSAKIIDTNSITILDDNTVIEENGSSPDTMWITVIVVVSCVFVLAVGFVAYQSHERPQPMSSELLNDEAHIANSNSQTVCISDSHTCIYTYVI